MRTQTTSHLARRTEFLVVALSTPCFERQSTKPSTRKSAMSEVEQRARWGPCLDPPRALAYSQPRIRSAERHDDVPPRASRCVHLGCTHSTCQSGCPATGAKNPSSRGVALLSSRV